MSYLFYNLIVAAKEVTNDLPADQAAAINKIFELVDALAEDLTRTQRLVDEQIREVEEVAKDLCGWTEGEEHPEDMRVSLALAHLVANATPRSESASASAKDPQYDHEGRSGVLVEHEGVIACLECYDGKLRLPRVRIGVGEGAAAAAKRCAAEEMGLCVDVLVEPTPVYSIEDGAGILISKAVLSGPSAPHPVGKVGYLRWASAEEAQVRLVGADAKALVEMKIESTAPPRGAMAPCRLT